MSARTPATIVLMGLRGSGKSTLGRRLAEDLGVVFVDLDDRTASALGCATPGEALRSVGEERFRIAEAESLDAALDRRPGVLALGGGTPTAPGAADALRARADAGSVRVLYLRATPETLGARLATAGGPDRPALVGDDPIIEIGTLFDRRDRLYRELAGAVLHLDGVAEDAAYAMLRSWAR